MILATVNVNFKLAFKQHLSVEEVEGHLQNILDNLVAQSKTLVDAEVLDGQSKTSTGPFSEAVVARPQFGVDTRRPRDIADYIAGDSPF